MTKKVRIRRTSLVTRRSPFEAEKTALYVQRKMAFFQSWRKWCFLGTKRQKMNKNGTENYNILEIVHLFKLFNLIVEEMITWPKHMSELFDK